MEGKEKCPECGGVGLERNASGFIKDPPVSCRECGGSGEKEVKPSGESQMNDTREGVDIGLIVRQIFIDASICQSCRVVPDDETFCVRQGDKEKHWDRCKFYNSIEKSIQSLIPQAVKEERSGRLDNASKLYTRLTTNTEIRPTKSKRD